MRPNREPAGRIKGLGAMKLLFAFVLTCLVAVQAEIKTAPPSKEYQVKAVFLFHFAQFVHWPPAAFSNPQQPLIIGVLGTDPFGDFLDAVVKGEKIGARPIVVKRCGKIEDATDCNILFVSGSDPRKMQELFQALKNKPVLTVGESDDFAQTGGMIRFATEDAHLRLKINLKAVQDADLSISSKLLRLADIVASEKG